MRVAVIGAGSWGTCVASLAATRAEVVLWARRPELAVAIDERHENPDYVTGFVLPESLRATSDLAAVLAGADAVLVAVPSHGFRSVLELAREHLPAHAPVISLAKGLEEGSLLRMTEVARQVLKEHPAELIGLLTGPNLASEVIAGLPAASVIAIPDQASARTLQGLLMTPTLRVYTNDDLVGCEIAGVIKNVVAIAAGIASGLRCGDNAMAALITRGLAELTRLGVALGGNPLTFLGLAGIGDLVVTCTSPQSRNRRVGEQLGRGRGLAEVVGDSRMVAEGVRSTRAVLALADRHGVDMPIAQHVSAILDGGRDPVEVISSLMLRGAKPELYGIALPVA